MKSTYRQWLEGQKYAPNTVAAQMFRAGRVEEHYGDLDEHFRRDRMQELLGSLSYSAEDGRVGRPNPAKFHSRETHEATSRLIGMPLSGT